MYNIPVLFVFFNRKDVALSSFDKIRAVKPSKIYLAQDGAREEKGEAEVLLTEDIRKCILERIDWECDVHTLFRPKNVGCSLGVKTAIDWVMETEECAIVLEDDCVVQDSFWQYMQEMLTRYVDDSRIGMVAGFNALNSAHCSYSYTFSRYKACWGWATWRRAWKNMDIDMRWRNADECISILHNMGYRKEDIRYWKYRLKCIDTDWVSAWDWQWYFTLSSQNQLCVFPKVSLVSNIGFGEGATHTSNYFSQTSYSFKDNLTFPLIHPEYVVPNCEFDKHFYHYNNDLHNKVIQVIPFEVKRFLKKILK